VYLRCWLSEPLTIVFVGSLDVMIWADVGLVSQFSTIETTIRVSWGLVSYWCTWAISMMIWNMWCLLAELLELLGWTMRLRILQIISTWSTRTKLRSLWWVEVGTCVADCPCVWNLRFCSPSSTSLFSRPMFCLVMLRSPRSCDSIVDSWVALSDHPGSVLASLGQN
jgi:hypothetical protein